MEKIIKKCLDELSANTPRLDYIRGILETLLEMQPEKPKDVLSNGKTTNPKPVNVGSIPTAPADEGAILYAKARAALDTIKTLNQEPTNAELVK